MTVLEQARDLKNRAMDERDLENWDEALRLLDEARSGLTAELQQLANQPTAGDSDLHAFATAVRKQLYHILGSIGGVYRRRAASAPHGRADLESAVRFYDEGWEIEREFTDSYNLTQRLVTRILLEPTAAFDDAVTVRGVPVRKALDDAWKIIAEQTGQNGPRNQDEYAFADAAVVAILLGNVGWMDAVREFTRRAPASSYARNVTLELLAEIQKAAGGEPPRALVLRNRVEDVQKSIA